MRKQEELELAFKSVLATQKPPEDFALRVMTHLAKRAESTDQPEVRITKHAAHFAWIVVPNAKRTSRPSSIWQRLASWMGRKQDDTLALGLLSSSTVDFESSTWQPLVSLMVHALVLAAILILASRGTRVLSPKQQQLAIVDVDTPSVYLPTGKGEASGGGGGGARQTTPPSAGKAPVSRETTTPVPLLRNPTPSKLEIEPAMMAPPIALNSPMPDIGMPLSKSVGLASAGPGSGGGIGSGSGGGLGSGNGTGIGVGKVSGFGGGLYHVGNGVSPPALIHFVDPEFTDEARSAKYQGICMVSLIVDAQGNPTNLQIIRRLGMGLDERALEAVKQYKFRPATLHGKPVAVQIVVAVNFQIL